MTHYHFTSTYHRYLSPSSSFHYRGGIANPHWQHRERTLGCRRSAKLHSSLRNIGGAPVAALKLLGVLRCIARSRDTELAGARIWVLLLLRMISVILNTVETQTPRRGFWPLTAWSEIVESLRQVHPKPLNSKLS